MRLVRIKLADLTHAPRGVRHSGFRRKCSRTNIRRERMGQEVQAPPKPQNVLSPDASLQRLIKGNERYVAGEARRHDFKHEREALVGGQNPYAGILSCADSRIAPEYAFDSGRGDLFVCRVAG